MQPATSVVVFAILDVPKLEEPLYSLCSELLQEFCVYMLTWMEDGGGGGVGEGASGISQLHNFKGLQFTTYNPFSSATVD